MAAAVEQDRLAQGVLQPVDLKQKFDLAFESIAVPRNQPGSIVKSMNCALSFQPLNREPLNHEPLFSLNPEPRTLIPLPITR